MKITIKGQLFELMLTPILSEHTSVEGKVLSFDDEILKNINTYMELKNMFCTKIYRHDYLEFKKLYDKHDILTTKKITILFRKFAEINNYIIKDFNTMGKRSFVILK